MGWKNPLTRCYQKTSIQKIINSNYGKRVHNLLPLQKMGGIKFPCNWVKHRSSSICLHKGKIVKDKIKCQPVYQSSDVHTRRRVKTHYRCLMKGFPGSVWLLVNWKAENQRTTRQSYSIYWTWFYNVRQLGTYAYVHKKLRITSCYWQLQKLITICMWRWKLHIMF